jgi:hypothetical protein
LLTKGEVVSNATPPLILSNASLELARIKGPRLWPVPTAMAVGSPAVPGVTVGGLLLPGRA